MKKYLAAALLLGVMLTYSQLSSPSLIAAESLSDAEKYQRIMAMYADYQADIPGIEEIDAASAIKLLGDPNIVFVDVRKAKEQDVSMIPGAVTSEVFLADIDRFHGQRIIVYCTIGYRSGKLAVKMGRKGARIANLKGGLLAWVHAGGPMVHENLPVRILHVYGRKWDLAPKSIETTY